MGVDASRAGSSLGFDGLSLGVAGLSLGVDGLRVQNLLDTDQQIRSRNLSISQFRT